MVRQAVKSHVLISVGYDPVKKILQVQFPARVKDNVRPVYNYLDVPQEKYDALMGKNKAEGEEHSIGSHFLKFIKPNFKFERVEDTVEDAKQKAPESDSPETE